MKTQVASHLSVFILLGLSITLARSAPAAKYPPETPKHEVTDEYHGTKVSDPYRWLEDAGSPETQKWTEAQNLCAHQYLDALPQRKKNEATLQKWNDFHSPVYRTLVYRGGRYFSLKLAPPKNQALLVSLQSLQKPLNETIILDPTTLDAKGTTAIDFFEPSLDGKKVAVSLSKGGSEVGTLHIYDTASGKELSDVIDARVNNPTAGGSVAWNSDSTGIYYTRYPKDGERAKEDLDFYQQVYFHKLGTPAKDDTYSIGKDFPRIAEIELETSNDGKWILAKVANGDGGEFAHYVLDKAGKWTQISQFKDKITHSALGARDDLYLVSLEGSPKGKVIRLALSEPVLSKAMIVLKEGEGVVQEILPTQDNLYVAILNGGPSEVRVLRPYQAAPPEGTPPTLLATPALSEISGLHAIVGNEIFFRIQNYLQPIAWFTFTPPANGSAKLQPAATALATKSAVSFKDIEVTREFATSKDGTRVPISILFKKGIKKNGKNPTLLYAYGGYGVTIAPRFSNDLHLWLERGGIYAVANIRGGGEFGEAWHLAGNLTKKQNVFDDFISAAHHMIENKYTSSEHLAIEGASNGGLLMGAVLTQAPSLFKAVVTHVGIYDMLRVELDPNGAFNVTEFGTVKDPEQFKALYAYSPFHNVKDRTAYPSVLLLTGANDGRVNPFQSKKMAARLQAATSSGKPVLLRVTFDGGHGMGRSISQKVSEEADVFSFLMAELGVK